MVGPERRCGNGYLFARIGRSRDDVAGRSGAYLARCVECGDQPLFCYNPADRPSSAVDVVNALETSLVADAPKQPRRRSFWASVGAVVIFLSLAAVLSRSLVRKDVPRHPAAADRIVVLPPRVDDTTLTLFADGLTDAIRAGLSQYGGADGVLGVLPASEVRRGQVDAPSIARDKFGARYAVETALQSQGDKLRLTMAVIDTRSMAPKESSFVDGTRSNALAFQDSALERLAGMLNAGVQPKYASELNRMNSLNPGAYEFYLQAKGYLKRNDRPGDIDAAIGVAQKALDRDPKNA